MTTAKPERFMSKVVCFSMTTASSLSRRPDWNSFLTFVIVCPFQKFVSCLFFAIVDSTSIFVWSIRVKFESDLGVDGRELLLFPGLWRASEARKGEIEGKTIRGRPLQWSLSSCGQWEALKVSGIGTAESKHWKVLSESWRIFWQSICCFVRMKSH